MSSGKALKLLDRVTGSASTKYLINKFLKEYGRLTELHIDRENGISASILLNGETRSLQITIKEYALIRDGNTTSLNIREAFSDRPWLSALLENHVIGNTWEIPENAARLLCEFFG